MIDVTRRQKLKTYYVCILYTKYHNQSQIDQKCITAGGQSYGCVGYFKLIF